MKAKLENREFIIVVILFITSVAVRFYLSDFLKVICIYPDELRYYMISENIATGRGISLYNECTNYQKILYSIVLLPAFLLKTKAEQLQAIALINAVIMSTGVFPVYFLSKEILKTRVYIIAACILYVIMPDMAYTMTFMSEVVYIPLALWLLYFFCKLINWSGNKEELYVLSSFIGAIIYVIYLNKEVALAFPLAYIVYVIVYTCFTVKDEGKTALQQYCKTRFISIGIMGVTFMLIFLVFKHTLFAGMGNSYNQTSINILFQPGRIKYLVYGFCYYLGCIILGFGFFPVVFPGICYKEMSERSRKFYLYIMLLLLVSAAVVAYTITVREDFPSVVPRIHLRYVSFLAVPFLIMMLYLYETMKAEKSFLIRNTVVAVGLYTMIVIMFYKGVRDGSAVDQIMLNYADIWPRYHSIKAFVYLVAITIIAGTALFWKKRNLWCWGFLIAFSGVQIFNNSLAIKAYHDIYSITQEEYNGIERFSGFIRKNADKQFLFVSDPIDYTQHKVDTFLNFPNVKMIEMSKLLENQGADGTDLRSQKVAMFIMGYMYQLDTVDYMLVRRDAPITLDGETGMVFEGFEDYIVYSLNGAEKIPHISQK